MTRFHWLCLSLAVAACTPGGESAPADVPLYDNLGSHNYAVTNSAPLAQQYFDQGLRLYYAFNHAEAIRAFEAATRHDDACAMCWWGISLAYGPNINASMDSASGVAAWAALKEAERRADGEEPREQALIGALAVRYREVPPADRAGLDSSYARAMAETAAAWPDDPEVATLYAESLMDLSPWAYWNPDGSARPGTTEALTSLEKVLAAYPDHPGANHFYIHAVEAVDPERAVTQAERLAGLMPGAGHLVHMPGHIYVRVGRYEDAIVANEHAIHADESYIRDQRPQPGMYMAGYYPHNYDFLAFAASMIGRDSQAVAAAEQLAGVVPANLLREPGMTLLQSHLTRHLQMKVRFGRWDAILATEAPPEDLPHARGLWHYARGRALAGTGNLAEAEAELAALRALSKNPAVASLRTEFNTSGGILGIAVEVLAGHLAAARGDYDAAVSRLREAVRREDALNYGEPPEWSVPVRQDLGAILLDAGRRREAAGVFEEDLRRFPKNVWSVQGLADAGR
jgi:tetratricopeptide (TPR) repeat protein